MLGHLEGRVCRVHCRARQSIPFRYRSRRGKLNGKSLNTKFLQIKDLLSGVGDKFSYFLILRHWLGRLF